MNYKLIHDLIIARAKNREYDSSIHQLHHIIPRHEDPKSTETVPLTFKEHYIIHLLRWKIVGTNGNKIAYYFMKGIKDISKSKFISSVGGKKGGKTTKENKSGIFSDGWDRSAETSKRWQLGIISEQNFNGWGHCSKAGKTTKENKSGIFSDGWDRSEQVKREWASGSRDHLKEQNAIRGKEISDIPTWTNGTVNIKSLDYPGREWYLGQTSKTGKISKYTKYKNKTQEQYINEYYERAQK